MNAIQRLAVFAYAFLFIASPANASIVVFSNLVQPGNQYGPDGLGIGHTPAFTTAGDYLIYAVRFVPSASTLLSAFEAPLGVISGPNQLQAFFMSDSAGQPGTVLESFALSSLPNPPGPLVTIPSATHGLLLAGQQYWFAATGGPETFGMWTLNLLQGDPTDGGGTRFVIGGVAQPWTIGSGLRTGALQVFGDPVAIPEPSYTALLACIGTYLAARIRALSRQ